MSPNLEVVVGTYEQFLLGYTVDDVVNKYKMEQSFATHSHHASIRSVASNKYYLASAAADDTVCLFDMRSRAETGKLIHHNDTVNDIAFTPDASHLITVSSDGTIGVVRCGNWQVEKHWLKPHKGFAVDTVAVHPTGKIAMTTGRDGVLRTWNLVKGRQAYATNLVPRWKIDAKNISILKWSPNGTNYLLAANNKIDIYSVESAGIEEVFIFDSKVICVEYFDEDYIAVGLTNGKLIVKSKSQSHEIQAHNARLKCLAISGELLVSASSSGEIKLWSFKDDILTLLNTVDCNARISCLTLTSYLNLKHKKEEIDLEEKVPENLSNKLRLKQTVIIEDDEENKTKKMKKKKNKNARKLIDNENIDSENTVSVKKMKGNNVCENISENLLSKKHKIGESQLLLESVKKKKSLSDSDKKRKKIEDLNDNDSTELTAKNKKKKGEISEETIEVQNNQIRTNKKKRKNPNKNRGENLQKKQKLSAMENGILKKKRKKNFKNNISR